MILIAAAMFFSYTGFAQSAEPPSETLPQSVMNAEIKRPNGTSFRLRDSKAKAQILLLWASWCGPCRLAANALNKVRGDYAKQNVEIIGLDIDPETDRWQDIRTFVRRNRLRFEVGLAERETAKLIMGKQVNIPQIFIIANDGQMIKRFIGFSPIILSRLNEAVRANLTELNK